ncbi:phage repressor protein [Virgibacillus halodenitrificans]|uniref:Phage repressor protein n=1 Tax=Virgibacillus halodenitrificans TaxID=1482 RepID=A0AAC9J270_VIRHA|nr:helix-turn-helix transcriptional regulator [Virgibacillus halodenitrificans]APC48269.1 phage repressor protein [Virgibacillus halodenitrificans]
MNVNKLKGKIVENGLTVGELANQIGMDRSTLYRKISNDGDSLTIKDVNLICKVLKLTKEEAMSIFFNQFVA